MEKRKLLVIESRAFPATELKEALFNLDSFVLELASPHRKLVTVLSKNPPDLVLATLGTEDDTEIIQLMEQVRKSYPIPVIFISKSQSNYLFLRAKRASPVNYLIYPLPAKELEIALELALWNLV